MVTIVARVFELALMINDSCKSINLIVEIIDSMVASYKIETISYVMELGKS